MVKKTLSGADPMIWPWRRLGQKISNTWHHEASHIAPSLSHTIETLLRDILLETIPSMDDAIQHVFHLMCADVPPHVGELVYI